MCDEAVDDCLVAIKFVPDWFVTSEMIKKLFTALYADGNILFLMKILLFSHLFVMEWVFLIYILIILILAILTMIKMILILLFMSDFWLDILNLKITKNLKEK